jgi:trimethylamine--corrinoid protein Co-methyltransferase
MSLFRGFLQSNTVQHFKELWMPALSDPRPYQAWANDGARTVVKAASEKVKEVLATHKVDPLPEPVQSDLSRIIKEGEAEIPT